MLSTFFLLVLLHVFAFVSVDIPLSKVCREVHLRFSINDLLTELLGSVLGNKKPDLFSTARAREGRA